MQAKADVAKLGMTTVVEHAIRECMVLVKQGERKAAQDLLLAACRELSEKSGAFAEMRKMYKAPTRHRIATPRRGLRGKVRPDMDPGPRPMTRLPRHGAKRFRGVRSCLSSEVPLQSARVRKGV
ncbi:MAG: hypothetical protein ACT6S0_19685 [Roseateles sp.]|uniref:hypothetical protein n=1 Tax=Roseateles sp. TaxID=1971397 RepID=UPI0040361388